MKYRKEIDGLRAVALLPVIFFHAGFQTFSGGFVGVDVFFVISGYLITTIILTEQEAGTFTLANFYERRARRILPALFLVLFACLPFAWFWMLPAQLIDFSQSLIATSIFSSNIFFWLQSGYFEAAAELKPLLHTWSLGVEEQYYVLFPLFIVVSWKLGKTRVFSALLVIGLVSFLLATWGATQFPNANFYLIPTRLWELLIGSVAAFNLLSDESSKTLAGNYRKEILGSVGLLLIASAIFLLGDQTPFPSAYALPPTVGTYLIILYCTDQTVVGKLLSNRFLVGIGLISYSAYLWHQPLFAFARLRSVEEPNHYLMLSLGILTFVLAFFSWRYVEKPFRNKARFKRKSIFQGAAIFTILTLSVGASSHFTDGFASRDLAKSAPFALTNLDQRMRINFGLNKACIGFTLSEKCRTNDQPEILLWGDSHAMHLAQGIMASNPKAKLIQFTKSVCGPILNMAPINKKYPYSWSEKCLEFNNKVKTWIEKNHSVRYAMLGSPFTQYIMNSLQVVTPNGIEPADPEKAYTYLTSTLKFLQEQSIQPVIFTSPPTDGTDPGACLVKTAIYGGDTEACNISVVKYQRQKGRVIRFLKKISETYRVVWLDDFLCSKSTCVAETAGQFIYRDKWHLSHEGSAYIGRQMDFYRLITAGD